MIIVVMTCFVKSRGLNILDALGDEKQCSKVNP